MAPLANPLHFSFYSKFGLDRLALQAAWKDWCREWKILDGLIIEC